MFQLFQVRGLLGPSLVLGLVCGIGACGADSGADSGVGPKGTFEGTDGSTKGGPVPGMHDPILFVTQVPISGFASVTSTFGNQAASITQSPPGGDLYVIYPDGSLRNLTQEAGFGNAGLQGANAIAVREPSVYWDGTKALFSMAVGAPTQQFKAVAVHWQIYEVTGLAEGQKAVITKVPNQPAGYDNVAPIYGTDDRIIFTSDLPRNRQATLYPQLDEYESTPTVTGLWSLDPVTGNLILLEHAPSGVFSPTIDSAGRLVFTKWDHLQRDQQADADKFEGGMNGSFNYADESGAMNSTGNNAEVFPEPRLSIDPLLPPDTAPHEFNHFFPWTLNEDGSTEETMNHVGRHEFGGSYTPAEFTNDPALSDHTPDSDHLNRYYVFSAGGFFQIKEDPTTPGTYWATESDEFATDAAGGILKFTGGITLNGEEMVITNVTDPVARSTTTDAGAAGHPGHFRDALPLSSGGAIAAHTTETREDANDGTVTAPQYRYDFRLKVLEQSGSYWVAGTRLTPGISKSITYWNPDSLVTVSGNLWELNPVEVRARPRPTALTTPLPTPESTVLQQKGVDVATLRAWLKTNNLGIFVSRNVTTRDRADVMQPFNLQVPGGAETLGNSGKVYDVSYLQFFEGDQIRGYATKPGRRVLAEPLHDPAARNPPSSGPAGSVAVASDGSMAVIVPAGRAMSWQLTDSAGNPVVRERNWISVAPGEIRACPSCHGLNTRDQAGAGVPMNPPLALGQLLDFWKSISGY